MCLSVPSRRLSFPVTITRPPLGSPRVFPIAFALVAMLDRESRPAAVLRDERRRVGEAHLIREAARVDATVAGGVVVAVAEEKRLKARERLSGDDERRQIGALDRVEYLLVF